MTCTSLKCNLIEGIIWPYCTATNRINHGYGKNKLDELIKEWS